VNAEPRTEYDSIGAIEIPALCYWGAQTARARERLFVCGIGFHPSFLEATILVKKASALVNAELEQLESPLSKAIVQACDEVLAGKWRDQFIIEPFQSGAGVVFNLNVNEVLANRAEEILGGSLGEYKLVDPEKHVNLSQCANDVFPTAMRIALLTCLKTLEPIMLDLERVLRRKALKFATIVKVGRTHLIDSQPITLGQEFSAFASSIEHSLKSIREASNKLLQLNIGAGWVGTGFAIHPAYGQRMAKKLAFLTNFPLIPGSDFLRLAHSTSDFLPISSALKEFAIELNQISNDLRLLNSGSQAGISEITLPGLVTIPSATSPNLLPAQSIPHLAESLNMVSYQVMGNDVSITMAAQSGQLEANVMTPLIIHNLLQSLALLTEVSKTFTKNCLNDISVNTKQCEQNFNDSGFLLVALSEQIGQSACQAMLELFGGNLLELRQALLKGELVSAEILEKIMPHTYLTSAGIRPKTKKSEPK
jgi:aspartate ammonia-lyase